jgi:hypothetical protein
MGLTKTINIRCIYGIFSREITKYTVLTVHLHGSGQTYIYIYIYIPSLYATLLCYRVYHLLTFPFYATKA